MDLVEVSNEVKNWSVIAHLSALLGFIFPLGNILDSLLVRFFKRDEDEFIGTITIVLLEEVVELVPFSVPQSIRVFLLILAVLFFLYTQVTAAYYLKKKSYLR